MSAATPAPAELAGIGHYLTRWPGGRMTCACGSWSGVSVVAGYAHLRDTRAKAAGGVR